MFGEPEDLIDWGCDDEVFDGSSSNNFTNTTQNTRKIHLKATTLVLHLKEGQLILTRGKTHYLWQDNTSHIWPSRLLYNCLNSFSIEVQCIQPYGEISTVLLEKNGTIWEGYCNKYLIGIKVDYKNAERLITGSEIMTSY